MARKPSYYLVGATWWTGGVKNDRFDEFIKGSYWEMGYDDKRQPGFAEKRKQIEIGDRIIIKKNIGPEDNTKIIIRAIGIVIGKDNSPNGKVFVDWKVHNLKRRVESHGCYKTIHGPFQKGPWIRTCACI